jgi:septin family protein
MNRKKAMTMSSIYEKEEREVKDERIHCCLLFFRGVRLHKDDVYILEQLHDKCIIVPVIAKGDCYTIA